MIRERLKEIDLRITELADYLQISRPTMYKFIEYYEQGAFELINKKVLKLFNYIKENELIGKKNVVSYILSDLVELTEAENDADGNVFRAVKKYFVENPESKKSQLIGVIATKDVFDKLVCYLADISGLVGKEALTDEEKEKLAPYLEMIEKI